VAWAGVFYTFLGLQVLYLFLNRYVRLGTAVLTVGVVFLSTNLLYYTFWEPGMSHAPLFGLVSCVLLLAENYLKRPRLLRRYCLVFWRV